MAEVYGVDFGGTSLRAYVVDSETGVLGREIFNQQIKEISSNEQLTKIFLENIPRGSRVGISAAGTIDEQGLIILQSPNSNIKGSITFAADLAANGREVALTNDMKAAVQAAARFGEGKGYRNVLVATYSSGYNCAVARDLENVSQAEFGHIPYGRDLFCGCGKLGHLEVYLSGNGAATMAKQYFDITKQVKHPILQHALRDWNQAHGDLINLEDPVGRSKFWEVVQAITAKHVYAALRQNPEQEPQRSIRATQVQAIADSFVMMNAAYNPLDIMVLMGSQTKDWDLLFEPAKEIYYSGRSQMDSLHKPAIVRTHLPEIGVQGAAAYFLQKEEKKLAPASLSYSLRT